MEDKRHILVAYLKPSTMHLAVCQAANCGHRPTLAVFFDRVDKVITIWDVAL